MKFKTTDLLKLRLHNHQLSSTRFNSPEEIVSWMGAMQAQEYAMSKWAIGIRLPQCTEQQVNRPLDKGEIIRTHVLRPTWHYVAAEDLHWMLALSAPRQKQAMKSREKVLGLTPAIYSKSNKVIEKALSNGEHLTRREIVAVLQKAKIDAKNEKGGYMLVRAELEGIICSGIQRGKEITYALLAQRVTSGKAFPREEALAKLAHRYFTSHGPATVQDFTWWSGLSITEGKQALEAVKENFEMATIDDQAYYFAKNLEPSTEKKSSCFLLPAFDEYVVAYADRSAMIADEKKTKSIFDNGLFRTVILVNGKALGNWKRVIKKDKVAIEMLYFQKPAKSTEALVKKAIKQYERFISPT